MSISPEYNLPVDPELYQAFDQIIDIEFPEELEFEGGGIFGFLSDGLQQLGANGNIQKPVTDIKEPLLGA